MCLFAWSVCAAQGAVPEVESFNIELGQEFASDVVPLEGGERAVVLFVGTEPRRLALIDATSRSVVEGPEGSFPDQVLAFGGTVVGRNLYLCQSFGLTRLDLDTRIMTTLYEPPIAPGPSAVAPIALTASRQRLYTVSAGHVVSADTTTGEVLVLGQVQDDGYYGLALSRDEREVYTVDFVNGMLTRYTVDGGAAPVTSSYVTSSGIERTIPRVAVAPDGMIYAGYVGPEAGLPRFHLSVLDPAGNLLANQIYPFFSTGLDLTSDGRFIILGNGSVIERQSLGIVARATTGHAGNEVQVTADGRRAYVANYNSTYATVIDLETLPLKVAIEARFTRPTIRPDRGRSRDISVAILSSADFDATTVDPASVCFGSITDPDARACADDGPVVHPMDVNHDRRMDLTLRYEAGSTGIASADLTACLTGRTRNGRSIAGCDTLHQADAEGPTLRQ